MSFGHLGGDHGGDFKFMAATAIAQPRLVTQNLPRLSLALQMNSDGLPAGDMMSADACEPNLRRRSREEEAAESRSGSDDGGSGDDGEAADNPRKKKRYHRHTPQQIQELEGMFKECPHPDEKQRLDLSRRLSLETRQVKFWFQNRRTQMKTQLERHENTLLRQENDKLRADNMSIREAMRNPTCSSCGGPVIIDQISFEEQQLRIENARLKDELDRVCALAGKFLGRPIAPPMSSSLELGIGSNDGLDGLNDNLPLISDSLSGIASNLLAPSSRPRSACSADMSMYLELALAAMDELVKMTQTDEPLWVKSFNGGREMMNSEEYQRMFSRCIGIKPDGFVTEASKETGIVIINSSALVETLMDSNRWSEMFPNMIATTTTTDVISGGMAGTRNGALQLVHAELQVLSPMVPAREVNFLRFCKQHADGVWAVVDVSIDRITGDSPPCRRLPSGCLVHDMPNGYSKVIWVEHAEYDETNVHQLYRPLLRSGLGFGARRWVATLRRQCDSLAVVLSSAVPSRDHSAITVSGRRSMLKLAQRMTANFCAGVCASSVYKWNKLSADNPAEDVRVMARKSVDDPGEPPGTVLSAATSVWLPISPRRLFHFLRHESLRSQWDILSNGSPMHEIIHIPKGHDHRNRVSLLRAAHCLNNQSSMLILQETAMDASGSLVVYAPVDAPAMQAVMLGGDSAYVALLPSGFAIVPDESSSGAAEEGDGSDGEDGGGSLLTVAFQILVSSVPTDKLTVESVETVKSLISCTVQKIRAAVQ